MENVLQYLNPIHRLGNKKYSFLFPLFTTLFISVALEVYASVLVQDPTLPGVSAILLLVAAIIYFSFRDGVRGGIISIIITISYYIYIIETRDAPRETRITQWETTAVLGLLYLVIASVIGGLKQIIDNLIEREANERRRLQAIVEQLPVGVLITDKSGKIVQANKQVEAIVGRGIRSNLYVGKDTIVNAHYRGKPVPPSKWPLATTLSTGKPVVGREFVIFREDGKKLYVQISASVIRNSKGNIIAAASILNDITHQKEIEERKDDFVNMASHELKTPITSLKLYLDTLIKRLDTQNDERARRTVLGIKKQTERLQALVSDLLDVSRLQTGKLGLNREPFSINELVEETVEGLKGSSRNQKIIVVTPLSIVVYADRFRIYQVVTNLVTNAIKYSPENTEIVIQVKKDRQHAIVSVKDQGIGITKEQQKKIFDRLYQVTDSTEKTFPGLGMGLYISKEIVKRNKGTIWVESEKGKGSTFYFSLPLYKKK